MISPPCLCTCLSLNCSGQPTLQCVLRCRQQPSHQLPVFRTCLLVLSFINQPCLTCFSGSHKAQPPAFCPLNSGYASSTPYTCSSAHVLSTTCSTAPLCKRQKHFAKDKITLQDSAGKRRALAGASRQPCMAIQRGDRVRRYLARRTVIGLKRDLKAIQWVEVSGSVGTGELRGAKDEGDQRASHQKLSRTSAQAVAKPQRRRLGSAAHAGCEGGHGAPRGGTGGRPTGPAAHSAMRCFPASGQTHRKAPPVSSRKNSPGYF